MYRKSWTRIFMVLMMRFKTFIDLWRYWFKKYHVKPKHERHTKPVERQYNKRQADYEMRHNSQIGCYDDIH